MQAGTSRLENRGLFILLVPASLEQGGLLLPAKRTRLSSLELIKFDIDRHVLAATKAMNSD